MKPILAVIAILALVSGGWFYTHRQAPAAPAPVTDGFAPETPAPADSATPGATNVKPGGQASGPTLGEPALPADVQAALTQADALWTQAGNDAVHSAKAPQLSRLYSQVLRGLYGKEEWNDRAAKLVEERLQPLGDALFFSKTPYNDDPSFGTYVAVSGDVPDRIAKKFGISVEFLNTLRGRTDPRDGKLVVGETLKVVKLAGQTDQVARGFQIHIAKSTFLMDVYVAGMLARRYQVSHGADKTPTPVGNTHITNRVWHPDWTPPTGGGVIHYGEPDHLLGPIWLPFDGKELGRNGIGIHGFTGADAKWSAMVSNGCIRMHNEQAIELYDLLGPPERSPITVEIVE